MLPGPIGLLAALLLLPATVSAEPFDFQTLVAEAKDLAGAPYQPPRTYDDALATWDFAQWDAIRHDPAQWLWPGSRFRIALSPPGYLFNQDVEIVELDAAGSHPRTPADVRFAYPDPALAEAAKAAGRKGFAGLRVLYPLNSADKFDEVLSFQGASYFRALARGQWYGLSARGIAIDTGLGQDEEFPGFRRFYLARPAPSDDFLRLYALLDGPSVTGAYQFLLRPGAPTTLDVEATIFLRQPVERLGLAPLTSMFLQGENSRLPITRLNPEEHDSDGLWLQRGEEHLWRSLQNPLQPTYERLDAPSPRAFGLLQRDRRFEHYQSLFLHYQDRPGAWVEPVGDWGPGRLTLLQLPTDTETQDNIVSYWEPAEPPAPGEPLHLAYRLVWGDAPALGAERARVVNTLTGRLAGEPDGREYAVDFSGPALEGLDIGRLSAALDVGNGSRAEAVEIRANPHAEGVRLRFVLRREGARGPLRLRGFLQHEGRQISETWDYVDHD
ncbi:MAG: glucan biosynthesis protein [Pseudomonadota bacterium]|nr:glucan biosynthesis protein [Pseudomonadota bacterium]HJO35617.1 glucan biosynthesis protein [Gammaproteobacteria bacterium]